MMSKESPRQEVSEDTDATQTQSQDTEDHRQADQLAWSCVGLNSDDSRKGKQKRTKTEIVEEYADPIEERLPKKYYVFYANVVKSEGKLKWQKTEHPVYLILELGWWKQVVLRVGFGRNKDNFLEKHILNEEGSKLKCTWVAKNLRFSYYHRGEKQQFSVLFSKPEEIAECFELLSTLITCKMIPSDTISPAAEGDIEFSSDTISQEASETSHEVQRKSTRSRILPERLKPNRATGAGPAKQRQVVTTKRTRKPEVQELVALPPLPPTTADKSLDGSETQNGTEENVNSEISITQPQNSHVVSHSCNDTAALHPKPKPATASESLVNIFESTISNANSNNSNNDSSNHSNNNTTNVNPANGMSHPSKSSNHSKWFQKRRRISKVQTLSQEKGAPLQNCSTDQTKEVLPMKEQPEIQLKSKDLPSTDQPLVVTVPSPDHTAVLPLPGTMKPTNVIDTMVADVITVLKLSPPKPKETLELQQRSNSEKTPAELDEQEIRILIEGYLNDPSFWDYAKKVEIELIRANKLGGRIRGRQMSK